MWRVEWELSLHSLIPATDESSALRGPRGHRRESLFSIGGNEVGAGRPGPWQAGPPRAAALSPGRFHRSPLGAAVPHEAPCGLPAAAPDGSAVRGRPPVLCPRPAPLHLSAARGRRRTPPASVVQGGGCTCRRDTAARARTHGPGNARCHKGDNTWAPTARAAVAGRQNRRENRSRSRPPATSAPAARPVQLRLAPGCEVAVRLRLISSLQ